MNRQEALNDGWLFPWTPRVGTAGHIPSKMRWKSDDPDEKTWLQFFHRYEHDRAITVVDLCAEYGVSERHAGRIWTKYDRHRKRKPILPTADPLKALRDLRQQGGQS